MAHLEYNNRQIACISIKIGFSLRSAQRRGYGRCNAFSVRVSSLLLS